MIALPRCAEIPFRIAVGGITTPFKWLENHNFQMTSKLFSCITRTRTFRRLAHNGWQVVDGPKATLTPEQYQEFISGSYAEISIAKNVYVAMHTGWFSCRSACYLAAGRPVVVQDTGFSSIVPAGEGILSFKTEDEAVTAIHEVMADYAQHAKAACAISEEYFDSKKVLTRLIEEAMSNEK